MNVYPVATWEGWELSFFPTETRAAFDYVVCFCMTDEGFLLSNNPGRGWVTPSGHVEPGESAEDAARREALEEAGATLGSVTYLGCYSLVGNGETKWAAVFVARVSAVGMATGDEVGTFTLAELPQYYSGWNPLFATLFAEASRY